MSITAILTLYKRPHTLIEQLTAVQNQSVPPAKIIIWKNHAEGIELPAIPSELMKNVTIIQSSENYGVWARFTPGLLVNTEYVCVFDDDTIPRRKWFENCLNTQKTHPGLLGAIGIAFNEGNQYVSTRRYGWDGSCETAVEVDIVGHAWFFRQEWLGMLWQFRPNYELMIRAGEDIAFSYMLQKHGIKTYVPPHPKDDIEMYGSDPVKAMKYGTDSAAITSDGAIFPIFKFILENMIDKLGFETIANRKAKERREKA
jgi:GT2 family glycosyltransferase